MKEYQFSTEFSFMCFRLSGLSPFQGTTEPETLCNITTAKWDFSAEEFECISSDAKDFISNLLVKDPRYLSIAIYYFVSKKENKTMYNNKKIYNPKQRKCRCLEIVEF